MRRSSPRAARTSRSPRTVTLETPSISPRSATRTKSWERTSSRMRARRWSLAGAAEGSSAIAPNLSVTQADSRLDKRKRKCNLRRMGGARLTRRTFLAAGAGVGVAAALGVASAGSPFAGGSRDLRYWHLFGGGDGVRMREMLDTFAKSGTDVRVDELILPWGNPYYTKLSLAAVGGRPPDVAVMHATRIAEFAPGDLLEPLPLDLLAKHGLSEDRFLPKLWSRASGRARSTPCRWTHTRSSSTTTPRSRLRPGCW